MLYRVLENRMCQAEYVIDADDPARAGELDGEIIAEYATDSRAYELISVEEV